MLAGAVRLRSSKGAVITLRVDDSLVTPLLVGAGEVAFVLKRLKRERTRGKGR